MQEQGLSANATGSDIWDSLLLDEPISSMPFQFLQMGDGDEKWR
jgi:hypothetical protein